MRGIGCALECRGHLIRQGDATFPDVMRVFFALTLTSMGIGQNTSTMADQAKAAVCTPPHTRMAVEVVVCARMCVCL